MILELFGETELTSGGDNRIHCFEPGRIARIVKATSTNQY
jgi:hypothetical protein